MEKFGEILRVSQKGLVFVAIATFYTTVADLGLIYFYRFFGVQRLYLMGGALVLAAGLWLARFLLSEEVVSTKVRE